MNNRLLTSFTVFLLFILVLGGCASSQYKFEYHAPAKEIVWPPEPEISRYRFVGVISGENNFKKIAGSEGLANRAIRWVGELLFGESAPRVLYRPQAGFFDSDKQRLYVSDVGNKSVFVFDYQLGKVFVWESLSEIESFAAPIGIAVLGGEVLVSDAEKAVVVRLDQEGNPLGVFGNKTFARPTGIVVDEKANRVFVADSKAHVVRVFTMSGTWLFDIGTKGAQKGKFNAPTHLAFADEKLYVSDTLNARIQIFDKDGNWLHAFGERGMRVGDLPRPKGVAIDSENHIYVVESYYDHMIVYDQDGRGLLPIGGNGSGPGQFYLPSGIWIDKQDKIYIADMFNSRVSVFQYIKHAAKREATQSTAGSVN